MSRPTESSIFNTIMTASTMFHGLPATGSFQVNMPMTASLMNYVPSSMGVSFQEDEGNGDVDSSVSEELEEKLPEAHTRLEDEDERCQQLWGECRDALGPWMTLRFCLDDWDMVKQKAHPKYGIMQDETTLEGFDGVLTKEIIAPNLSRIARCPELQHYSFTKCVLAKKKLTNIDALASYRYLQFVDLSSNKLTTLKPLGNLPFLKILDASHNLLTTILDFKAPYYLTVANLSHNKIKVMRDLSEFWSITDLILSHNWIKVIEGIKDLRFLTTLNLASNRIGTIENLDNLRIQYLFLQNNAITSEEDEKANLHTLKNIRIVNLSNNLISSLKMFEAVENLECLDIVNNNVSNLLDVYYLRNLKYLNKLNLTGNPVTDIRRYIEVCVTNIKNLIFLDGEQINSDYWMDQLSSLNSDVAQVSNHSRLKLLVLEQLNPPQLWDWLLPYDCPPMAVIVLVGLQASRRAYIARKFYEESKDVVVGIPYTTKPKHLDEVEGDYFYYVDDETFMSMLKRGEFLTYQENLGSYFGIAHSEFKKAENAILLFYTDLAMALAIRRKFINTVLVLALPSTREEHLNKLKTLYAVQYMDNDTLKILNSPVVAAHCQSLFEQEKQKLTSFDAQAVVEELVESACSMADEGTAEECDSSSKQDVPPGHDSRQPSMDESRKSEMLQLWWSTSTTNKLSIMIQPASASISVYNDARDQPRNSYNTELNERSKANLESAQNSAQMKRFVSFMVHNVENSEESSDVETQQQPLAIPATFGEQAAQFRSLDPEQPVEQDIEDAFAVLMTTIKQDNEEAREGDVISTNEITQDNTIPEEQQSDFGQTSSSFLYDSPLIFNKKTLSLPSYGDILTNDLRMKCLFEEELRQREELLELHLNLPGLFRELLFTDEEEETMDKLKNLVKDIIKYNNGTKKAMLEFENDHKFKNITEKKIMSFFQELRKEVSISDKQAGEYVVRNTNYCHGMSICDNPSCPRWKS